MNPLDLEKEYAKHVNGLLAGVLRCWSLKCIQDEESWVCRLIVRPKRVDDVWHPIGLTTGFNLPRWTLRRTMVARLPLLLSKVCHCGIPSPARVNQQSTMLTRCTEYAEWFGVFSIVSAGDMYQTNLIISVPGGWRLWTWPAKASKWSESSALSQRTPSSTFLNVFPS